MKYLLITAVLSLVVHLNVYDNLDGDKKNKKDSDTIKEQKADNNYYEKLNDAMFCLYDSSNIWWISSEKISDSLRNVKIPRYPDCVYEKRINDLNETTPMDLDYNEYVLKYIDAYGVRNRDKLQIVMTKSAYYFPIFEEYLDKYNLPLELKYLAAVESALDPTAVSPSGAVGLWQFMKPTADLFNLNITSYIDERRDVYKSTDAACRYLKCLYEMFEDWQLALVAYNGGPGTVKKAIARSGGKTDYWDLRPYFTTQMQNYVPAFIAMYYLMEYHAEHNIFPVQTFIEANKTDTLLVRGYLHLSNIAEVTGTDANLLKKLNPIYSYGYIPMDGDDHILVLPTEVTHIFLDNSDKLETRRDTVTDSLVVPPFMVRPERPNIIHHQVVSGDNFFRLAAKYNCSIPEIYKWNGLAEGYVLKIGDSLKIFVE
ncbi:MAG: transglycosylase SLT domain-containing protein [Bacteroidales bacterium]|nr:transglycosylase SLT domain-containing protein [Bacteroidales bacterium]MDD3859119.1 transglycosylase SLT domain-containing protein [Bacteroidales bacterium]